MISPGLNLVMTVIGFGVSTMFIVFVCTRLICARIQLRASTRSFARSDLSIMERGVNGLEPVAVSSFPMKFVDQLTFGQDTQCAVCLSEYQEKDVLRVLPYCGHAFHAHCIDTWLKHNWTCPVCRISLRDSPDRRKMRPLARENFVSDNFLADFVPDSVRVNESLFSIAEVNCSAEMACSFGPRVKQMDNPLDS